MPNWTAEEREEDALMVLPYCLDPVEAAGSHFDGTVRCIQAGQLVAAVLLEPGTCRECDLRALCRAEGAIEAGAG